MALQVLARSVYMGIEPELTLRDATRCSVFSAVGCGFLFFLSPILGQASDVYGRKVSSTLMAVASVTSFHHVVAAVPRAQPGCSCWRALLGHVLHAERRFYLAVHGASTHRLGHRVRT